MPEIVIDTTDPRDMERSNMVIEMRCPYCNKSIRTDDKNAGRSGRCVECGTPLEIPAGSPVAPVECEETATDEVYEAELVPSVESLPSRHDGRESTKLSPDGRPMKRCPICGEQILAVAVRCRYCKSPLADSPDRPGEGDFMVWRDNRLLVMHKESSLPDRCVKSNLPAEGFTLKRRLSWHNPLLYLIILLNLIIYAIVASLVQKTATIYIGLTREWAARRRRRIMIAWMGVIGGFVAMFFGIAGADRNPQMAWLIIAGIVGWLGSMLYGIISTRLVVATRITDEYIWLKGVHPDYLAMLPEWPGE